MSHSRLLALPEELIAVIAEHVGVEDVLNFALTCSQTYHHAKHLLAKHKEYHTEYEVQHDRHPLHSSKLLRIALEDPDVIWHLRAFESWGSRPGFEEWKSYKLDHDIEYNPEDDESDTSSAPSEDYSDHDASYYNPEEMVQYRMIMQDTLHMSPEKVHLWTERISEGWDEPIKGVLFALAPKLDRLNFIAHAAHVHDHAPHPLLFFCQAIRAVYDSLTIGGIWPVGFQSLRQVSICNTTTLQHPHDAYYIPPSCVAPLFLLPNVKILNLTLLGFTDDDDPDFFLPPKSSSVEELAFSCCSMTLQAFIKFIQGCKRLRSYRSIASLGHDEGEPLLQVLSRCHGPSLELLSLGDSHGRLGCWLGTISTKFPSLKSLEYLKLKDLLQDQSGNDHGVDFRTPYLPPSKQQEQQRSIAVQVVELRDTLPTGIENLHVDFTDRTGAAAVAGDKTPGAVLNALADLVEDARFQNIKTVCLNSLEEVDCDEAALRRIKARGIDTHAPTSTSRRCWHTAHGQGLAENETDPRSAEQILQWT